MSVTEQALGEGIAVAEARVRPEWIDINGHMNVAYYILAFDLAVDALWQQAGITQHYIEERELSTFAVESHVRYVAELKEGDPYHVRSHILAIDDKRLHQRQYMFHATEGFLAATAEWLNLHVDLGIRRVTPWPDEIRDAFVDLARRQGDLRADLEPLHMRIKAPVYAAPGYLPE